jgi:cytoskeleton protein RodZ
MDNLDILKIASKKLKSSREKLNISTKEVADDLRLDQKIIDDIDNANFKNFKNYVFLKGYLKNYANFLGVHLELPEINKKIKKNKKITENNIREKKNNTVHSKYFLTAAVLISFFFLVFVAQNENKNLIQDKESLGETNDNILSEKIESKKINQDQEFVIQKKSENTEEIKLLETTDKINLENNNIPSNNDTNVNSSSITDISDSTDKLIIIYSGDSWTEIIDSYGNIVFFDLVKDGDTIRLNIKAPFEILLGNATVVDITYNNNVINTQYINPDNNVGKINIKE